MDRGCLHPRPSRARPIACEACSRTARSEARPVPPRSNTPSAARGGGCRRGRRLGVLYRVPYTVCHLLYVKQYYGSSGGKVPGGSESNSLIKEVVAIPVQRFGHGGDR